MPTEDLPSPQAIVLKLKTDAVRVQITRIHGEYDDFYKIWYTPGRKHFALRLESSVWDGRGHESYKETLNEEALLNRLEKILVPGEVKSLYFSNR